MSREIYDLIIIGAGPAGLTASLYAARARLGVLVLEQQYPGGQAFLAHRIENFPGFPEGISGPELTGLLARQAQEQGARLLTAQVTGLAPQGRPKVVHTSEGDFRSHAVLLASGSRPRRLGVPGEAELAGRGVSYCATCDGAFFQGRRVAVVGGGDSALTEALYLARLASKVYLIHRRDKFRAARVLEDRVRAQGRIEVLSPAVVGSIEGRDEVTGLRLVWPSASGGEGPGRRPEELEVDGVFIYAGTDPETGYCREGLRLSDSGHVMTDEEMRTSAEGVFAAGDVRHKRLRQIVTACGDGAVAAASCEDWLAGQGLLR